MSGGAIAGAILTDIGAQIKGASSLKDQQAAGKEEFSFLRDQAQERLSASKLEQDRQRELMDRQFGLQQEQSATQRAQAGEQVQDAKEAFKDNTKSAQRGLQGQVANAYTRGNQRKISRWGI